MYRDIAMHVYRRATEPVQDGDTLQLPGWAFLVILVDIILFLPVVFTMGYTFNNVFPVLVMVEDPSPPDYEPVSLHEEPEAAGAHADESGLDSKDTRAISTSFRALAKTVYAISGWRSYFRGIVCWVALFVAAWFVYTVVRAGSFIPGVIAALISGAAVVQLYTAWCHIVISVPSTKRFYQRLPPFRRAFNACALPTALYLFALEIHSALPRALARLMGMPTWDPKSPNQVPEVRGSDFGKTIVVVLVSLALTVFLTIPAHVVLTRVQASLLPEEDETIVPFDRSFQGKVEPAIVGGRGYVTMKDAWQTFSRASWVRLVKLYAKLFLISLGIYLGMMVIVVPEMIIIFRNSTKVQV
jgi:hypothetical protein